MELNISPEQKESMESWVKGQTDKPGYELMEDHKSGRTIYKVDDEPVVFGVVENVREGLEGNWILTSEKIIENMRRDGVDISVVERNFEVTSRDWGC